GTAGASGNAGTSGGHVLVTVSGTAAPHPLNALVATPVATDGGTTDAAATDAAATDAASTDAAAADAASTDATDATSTDAASSEAGGVATNADFSQLKVSIVDPTAVITNPNAPPLASTTLDTSAANCTAAGCAFSLTGVDITNQTLGLVGTLEDKRTGDARLWVKTGTGMGTKAFIDSVKVSKAPIMDRRAFIVSRKLEAKLVTFVNAVLGTTVLGTTLVPGDLEARGFLIGHVLDKLSTATTPAGPAGVAGATVTAQGAFDVIYPNATFTGKGTATAASGLFLMVPKLVNGAAQAVVTNWMVVPPTGDARTWEAHLAGTNPGNAFIIIMPANE
ncbi:MAG: hypothetical protein JWM82_1205, partial [Myxococcales bacterium]|nr:hypothetical protein [Myxococcales bacterium]